MNKNKKKQKKEEAKRKKDLIDQLQKELNAQRLRHKAAEEQHQDAVQNHQDNIQQLEGIKVSYANYQKDLEKIEDEDENNLVDIIGVDDSGDDDQMDEYGAS